MTKQPTQLEQFVQEIGLDPIEAMNLLQGNAIVSDNCVWISEVPEADQSAAIKFLDGIV